MSGRTTNGLNGASTAVSNAYGNAANSVGNATDAIKAKLTASWANPGIALLLGAFVSLVFILVIYYNDADEFDSTGVIGASNPGVFGNYSGAWLYLLAFLGTFGAGTCLGLMQAKLTDAFVWMFGSIALMTLIFDFALGALIDLFKISFYLWTAVFILLPIVIAVVAILLMRRGIMTQD